MAAARRTGVGSLGFVTDTASDTAPEQRSFDIVCPHCKKPFTGELLAGRSERHTGFKCPHCKLIVAYERVEDE
jgi:phage FluMu protein Com